MVSLDRYEVTKDGQIFDKQTNKPVKIFKSNKYLQCCIYDENGKHVMGVHNVVAQVYCKDWFEGCVVHHKDNNQHNNNIENLECLERGEHTKHHNPNKYFDVKAICINCKKEFIWTGKQQKDFHSNKSKIGPFCSRHCVAQYTYKETEAMRNSRLNRKPEDYWNSKAVMCVETGITYPSAGEASRQLGIKSNFIRKVANDGHTAFGLHFKFI